MGAKFSQNMKTSSKYAQQSQDNIKWQQVLRKEKFKGEMCVKTTEVINKMKEQSELPMDSDIVGFHNISPENVDKYRDRMTDFM